MVEPIGAALTAAERRPDVVDRDTVVDCRRWLAEFPHPDLPVPAIRFPGPDPTGSAVRIALLDGRVDRMHPDLLGARIRTKPGVGAPGSLDPSGHATAHATLLVGQGRSNVRGLVPDAELLVAPVLGIEGRPADELIVRAVRWSLAEGAQVLVLPFGRRRPARGVAAALRVAAAAGVRIFVAAGDLGPAVLTFPASVTGVVAVTGYDTNGISGECSTLADVAAPGRDVPAAGAGRLIRLQGSSPAAVLAAGAWAAQLAEGDARGAAGRRAGSTIDHRDGARARDRLVDA